MASDFALRHRSAESGREYVRRWHSAERLVRDMESLYAELLAAGSTRPSTQTSTQPILQTSPGNALRRLLRRAAKAGQAMAAGIWE
jgi:hypothetical protein